MAILKIKAIKDDGSSYWPDRWPVAMLEEVRDKQMGTLRFSAEYQCEPVDLTGNFLKLESLRKYDYKDLPKDTNGVLDLDYYFGFDPSVSGHGDYCVICIMGKDRSNQVYMIDFIRKQGDLESQRRILEAANTMYAPKLINIEDNAAQQLLIQYLNNETALPTRSSQTRGRKEERFANMVVHFESGRVLVRGKKMPSGEIDFDPCMETFLGEWLAFPEGKYDDTLDAVEKCLEVVVQSIPAAMASSDDSAFVSHSGIGGYWGPVYKRFVRRRFRL